jgi:hypothetical protein
MLHYRKDLCILVFANRQQRRERQFPISLEWIAQRLLKFCRRHQRGRRQFCRPLLSLAGLTLRALTYNEAAALSDAGLYVVALWEWISNDISNFPIMTVLPRAAALRVFSRSDGYAGQARV